MKLHFITGNASKHREAQQILKSAGVGLVQEKIELVEPQTLDQETVVRAKAVQAYALLKKPVLVDDTGIYFAAYHRFPGTATKMLFASIGYKGIERLLDGVPRRAYFQTLLCYKDHKTTKIFRGVWRGTMVPRTTKNFNQDWQYDGLFVPEGFTQPLADIPLDVRAKHSHRKKAFAALRRYLSK